MSFSNSTPDKVLENSNSYKFLRVLDLLQDFKEEEINKTHRVHNGVLCCDNKWLNKKLSEYGLNIPLDYPMIIQQQILLNVDTFFRTRGSKIGLEFFLSILSLGEVTIDDSQFVAEEEMLILDSLEQGYIKDDTANQSFYLVDDSDIFNTDVEISFTIKSKYFNGEYPQEEAIIKRYIESMLDYWLSFSPDRTINIEYESREEFYYHNLLNPFFV